MPGPESPHVSLGIAAFLVRCDGQFLCSHGTRTGFSHSMSSLRGEAVRSFWSALQSLSLPKQFRDRTCLAHHGSLHWSVTKSHIVIGSPKYVGS